MSEQTIKSALVKAFDDAALMPRTETQYENVQFTVPTDKPWCALWFLPNPRSVASLGPLGQDEVTGIFQIDLNYPLNNGDKDVRDKATAITTLFRTGYRYAYSGVEVIVSSCGCSPGRIVDSFFRVSVTIAFYAHINR